MSKIIFDDNVTITQGRDLVDSCVPKQCVCINWKTDGYHQTWLRIPDNYEMWVDTNGDMHISEKHEKYFTGKITVTPYIIRETALGPYKKVSQSGLAITLSIDDGKVYSGRRALRDVICANFGLLLDNGPTRKAVYDCIRREFYNGSIFKHHSGIDIEWERG